MTYNKNLFDLIKEDQYLEPEPGYGRGDNTVPTFSSLIPALKWAIEFEEKKIKGAKPVKIADYCSRYNEKYSPYDETSGSDQFKITKNEFFGI